MNLVIDCSFIMSSLLDNKEINYDELELYNIQAPSIFYLECQNVLLNSLKRGKIDKKLHQSYLNIVKELPINIDQYSIMPQSLDSISGLSKKHNLSSYDASYLELAIRISGKIASFDKALLASAKSSKLEIFT